MIKSRSIQIWLFAAAAVLMLSGTAGAQVYISNDKIIADITGAPIDGSFISSMEFSEGLALGGDGHMIAVITDNIPITGVDADASFMIDLSGPLTAVPEPSACVLAGICIAGLLGCRNRLV
jgi:hypothetical protein